MKLVKQNKTKTEIKELKGSQEIVYWWLPTGYWYVVKTLGQLFLFLILLLLRLISFCLFDWYVRDNKYLIYLF